ncbi:MAG: DedA family protein [Gammaproteobacteria bacterium]|nr:DedA family protein [Gammaproteobacteria bacterium]
MELLGQIVGIVLHLDQHLAWFLNQYGTWIYALLFLIVFAETGLVVTPFLPGDSLLFVAGTLAGGGGMHVGWLAATLMAAAIMGDSTNYWIGRYVGPKVFKREDSWFFHRNHLVRTERFYERHGGKTVVLARFLPILRTFAPFVAGVGRMPYGRFLFFSVSGTVLWVGSLVAAGYFFGTLPIVKQNLSLVIFGIIILSILPGVIEYLRHRRARS